MVGVFVKQALDFPPIVLPLALQGREQFYEGQCQSALGPGDRRTAAKLMSFGEEF